MQSYIFDNFYSKYLENPDRVIPHISCIFGTYYIEHTRKHWRKRYIIIYIWKITQHMVSNIDATMRHKIKTRKHPWNIVRYYPINRNPP